jgi:hypothetical protein
LQFLHTGSNTIEVQLAAGRQGGFGLNFGINQVANKEYKCQDGYRACQSSGERYVDGIKVSRPCWQFRYTKTCDYPSKNDCYKYSSCSFIADRECLLNDRYGNCVNIKKEFSCDRPETDQIDVETVHFKPTSKNEGTKIVCMNIGCIDGNCVDKTSEINNEMMDSVSKLQAASKMKDHVNLQIFTGSARHCNQHMAGYHDCCKVDGWGKYLGAKCSAEEKQLSELRKQNKCVYVGKHKGGTVTKNHWCCFNNILEKLVQVQGRSQLGRNFGSSQKPKIEDLDNRIQNSMPNTRKHSDSNTDSENRKSGINANNEGLMKEGAYGE